MKELKRLLEGSLPENQLDCPSQSELVRIVEEGLRQVHDFVSLHPDTIVLDAKCCQDPLGLVVAELSCRADTLTVQHFEVLQVQHGDV